MLYKIKNFGLLIYRWTQYLARVILGIIIFRSQFISQLHMSFI